MIRTLSQLNLPHVNSGKASNIVHTPHDQADSKSIRTSDGYTADQEGLLNNYAIEPEMYVYVPGDLCQQAALQEAEWAHQLEELSEDEEGKLTMEHDLRHKGSGSI